MDIKCQKCNSYRIVTISAKCNDLCVLFDNETNRENDGYVPENFGIGGGDYVEFDYCKNCGQIQGTWPVSGYLEYQEDSDEPSH